MYGEVRRSPLCKTFTRFGTAESPGLPFRAIVVEIVHQRFETVGLGDQALIFLAVRSAAL